MKLVLCECRIIQITSKKKVSVYKYKEKFIVEKTERERERERSQTSETVRGSVFTTDKCSLGVSMVSSCSGVS